VAWASPRGTKSELSSSSGRPWAVLRAGLGVGAAGPWERHEQSPPGAVRHAAGARGVAAGIAAPARVAGTSSARGEQHPQTVEHVPSPCFIVVQAEASLIANDAAKMAARAISGQRIWRGVVAIDDSPWDRRHLGDENPLRCSLCGPPVRDKAGCGLTRPEYFAPRGILSASRAPLLLVATSVEPTGSPRRPVFILPTPSPGPARS
jgi:hypothetical protein